MHLLIITKELPYPKHKNGTTTTLFSLIMNWKIENEVTIISLTKIDDIGKKIFLNNGINVVPNSDLVINPSVFIKIGNKTRLKSRNLYFDIFNIDRNYLSEYNIVFFVGFESLLYYNFISDLPSYTRKVFIEIDCISLLYSRLTKTTNNYFKKYYYLLQNQIIHKIEYLAYKHFDKVFFVSSIDKVFAQNSFKKISSEKFQNFNNGVDVIVLDKHKFDATKINICFSGIFDYEPNFLASEFIIKNILDKLLSKHKNVNFHFIGQDKSKRLSKLGVQNSNQLIMTGFVEDINLYLSNMDIYISPLFVGTGMKNKILQAMNLGIPIICSTVSAEGIFELEHDKNCMICDSQDGNDWIFLIEKLINNEETRNYFSSECKKIIKSNYLWDSISSNILTLCNK